MNHVAYFQIDKYNYYFQNSENLFLSLEPGDYGKYISMTIVWFYVTYLTPVAFEEIVTLTGYFHV